MNRNTIHQQIHHRLEDLLEKHQEMMEQTRSIPQQNLSEFLKEIKVTYELALTLYHQNAIDGLKEMEKSVSQEFDGRIAQPNRTTTVTADTNPVVIPINSIPEPQKAIVHEKPVAPVTAHTDSPSTEHEAQTVAQRFKGGATLAEVISQGTSRRSDALQHAPVSDLRTAIGINERYQFIHHLFKGNAGNFSMTIDKINGCSSIDQAMNFLEKEVAGPNAWNIQSEPVQHFMEWVERRFVA